MKEPSKDYLDGFRRGIKTGHRELLKQMIITAKASGDDDYSRELVRWLREIQTSLGVKTNANKDN
jgi:hypothetical protein